MSTMRSFVTRASVITLIAFAGSTIERSGAPAHAGETKPEDAAKVDPGKAPPTVPTESEVISDCVKEAYASLDKEVPALRAMHASDAAGFANAFAARKRAVVGVDALRAKGCAIAKAK